MSIKRIVRLRFDMDSIYITDQVQVVVEKVRANHKLHSMTIKQLGMDYLYGIWSKNQEVFLCHILG